MSNIFAYINFSDLINGIFYLLSEVLNKSFNINLVYGVDHLFGHENILLGLETIKFFSTDLRKNLKTVIENLTYFTWEYLLSLL